VKVVARRAERVQVVRERGRRPAQPQLQAPDLPHAALDLSTEKYLATREALLYLHFLDPADRADPVRVRLATHNFRNWNFRMGVRSCPGRRGIYLRANLDRAMEQGAHVRHQLGHGKGR
jgi:hypothetical protein